MSLSPDVIGYVINNYSSCGQVQVKRFGYDDGISEDTNLFWCYVDQDAKHPAVAKVGSHHNLQPGCRVRCTSYGPQSYVISGTFPRMGSNQGGGGSDGDDSCTSYTDVDLKKADWVIPTDNPQENGQRCKIKAPDGRYSKYAGGQPLNMKNNTYPETPYVET